MSSKNLSYSLIESEEQCEEVTYEDLVKKVNEQSQDINENNYNGDEIGIGDMVALELNYRENYTKKQLDRIADYYQIPKRKKKKNELIEEIVIFEQNIENMDITQHRKTLWYYMEEIKNDNYLSKFLILD
tara:strand:+ start:529 stop:918 length:390 start_codon:yes stop_codon:yes gene_type:complete